MDCFRLLNGRILRLVHTVANKRVHIRGAIDPREVLIGFLEVVEVLAGRLEQAVDLKHMHARLRVLERHSLLDERRAEEIRKADRGRSCAQEQVALVLELGFP